MAWLATDYDGTEIITDYLPRRNHGYWSREPNHIELSSGTIKKLIGRELTWDDEPV